VKYTKILPIILLAAATFLIGALSCTIEVGNSTCGTGTKILGIQNETGGANNAHVQDYLQNTYSNSLCCTDSVTTLNNSCGTTIAKIDSSDNAHTAQSNESSVIYPVNICMDALNATTSCAYVDGSCPTDYTCMFSMANADGVGSDSVNAHVGVCGQYTRSVCCIVRQPSVCINETGVCYLTITAAIGNATAGQTVVIIDNSTYVEPVVFDKSLTLTSNGTGWPTIYGNNSSAISTGLNTVNISRVFVNISGSAGSMHALSLFSGRLSNVAVSVNGTGLLPYGIVYPAGGTFTIEQVNITMIDGYAAIYIDGSLFGATYTVNNTRLIGAVDEAFISGIEVSNNSGLYNSYINGTGTGVIAYASRYTVDNSTIDVTGPALESIEDYGSITSSYIRSTSTSPAVDMNSYSNIRLFPQRVVQFVCTSKVTAQTLLTRISLGMYCLTLQAQALPVSALHLLTPIPRQTT
jgi:hypothetical protein